MQQETLAGGKKTYTQPSLVEFGDVTVLTLGYGAVTLDYFGGRLDNPVE